LTPLWTHAVVLLPVGYFQRRRSGPRVGREFREWHRERRRWDRRR